VRTLLATTPIDREIADAVNRCRYADGMKAVGSSCGGSSCGGSDHAGTWL